MPYLGTSPQSGFITSDAEKITGQTTNYVNLSNAISSLDDVQVHVNYVIQDPSTLTLNSTTQIGLGDTLVSSDVVLITYLGKAVATQSPAENSVTNSMLAGSIANSKLANSSISINGSSVSLGGSLTGIGGANTPNFHIKNSTSSISNTTAKVLFTTEEFDTGNLVSSSRFTVDANTTGKYFLYASVKYAASSMSRNNLMIYKNGTLTLRTEYGNSSTYPSVNVSGVLNLSSSGDYVEVYADQNQGSNISLSGEAECNYFGGYKIIE